MSNKCLQFLYNLEILTIFVIRAYWQVGTLNKHSSIDQHIAKSWFKSNSVYVHIAKIKLVNQWTSDKYDPYKQIK